jgi:Sugar (and other) transporter
MAAWTGVGCYFASPEVQWRLALSLQIVAPLLLLIGSPQLPESPRWLISHSKARQGLEVLQKLHTRPGDPNAIAAKEEYYQIVKQIELEKQTGVNSVGAMLKRPSYRRRILAGLLVQYASPLFFNPLNILLIV